ncbi:hypothetical protein OUZ56_026003 [Daphnia magna]|uniref:Uncharacterized protein n=1 Tax=Daphnia magna TaxID=35525 RepID=A0ABQ9ZL09_9CRUS|nr:hypothetical protein OUZ56_026003 [Daphnia magna]
MEEKPITDKRTWKLPPRSCPCSLLGPSPAVLVLFQCPSPARRFQLVCCFRPARGSRPACGSRSACGSRLARWSTPARRFPQSVFLPALSTKNPFQVVDLFPGSKSYVNPLEPMEACALEQKGTIS